MTIRFSLKKAGWTGLLFLLSQTGFASANHYGDSIRAVELYLEAVDFARKGDPEKSLELFGQSLSFRKKVFGEKHFRLGSTYMGMAIQYKNLYQYDNAHQFYLLAEQMFLFNAPENDSRLGDVYTNIGNYYRLKGNFNEAIRYHERAVTIYENSSDDFPEGNYLSARYNLADCYHQVNREEEALKLISTFRGKGPAGHHVNYMNLMASVYTSMGRTEEAKSIHHDIIRLIRREQGIHDLSLARQYLFYAQFLILVSAQDSALVYLGKAEKIFPLHRNIRGDLADLYNSMGDAYASMEVQSSTHAGFHQAKKENLLTALGYYTKGLGVLQEPGKSFGKGTDNLLKSNFPIPALGLLRNLGRSCQQLAGLSQGSDTREKSKWLTEALDYFSTASDLVDYLRTGFVSEESKSLFTELQQEIYQYAIGTAFELHELTNDVRWAEIAFRHSERNKAASLYDQITEIESRSGRLVPDSLLGKESACQTKLAYYREKLYEENQEEKPDSAKIAVYRSRIFENEEMVIRIRESMEKNHRGYFEAKYRVRPLTFAMVRKNMKRDEVLLSYVVTPAENGGEGVIYTLALSKTNYHFTRQPFGEEQTGKVKNISRILSSGGFMDIGIPDFTTYCESAHGLYTILIAPHAPFIRGKRVTVIPGGILCYLPFEALLTDRVSHTSVHFHDLPYLIRQHPIHYAYSAELVSTGQKGNLFGRNRTVAFAPVYSGLTGFSPVMATLPEIPGSIEEVQYLKRRLKATLFTGASSTEKNFRDLAGHYQIIHLAMHTLINDSLPLYSRLAFSPEWPDSLHNDGWLNTADVYNLNLDARMTVLSACSTGSGVFRTGEGIISLARGFIYAGCPSVVMSLWDVEDHSASEIMKEFYRNLLFGKTKDAALQTAKLNYLQKANPVTAHPHLWLGYISIGDPEPLFSGIKNFLLVLMSLIMIYLVAAMVIKKPGRNDLPG